MTQKRCSKQNLDCGKTRLNHLVSLTEQLLDKKSKPYIKKDNRHQLIEHIDLILIQT